MYDHLSQRGYVRNVPGAPMCACVEQMPVVTRSDCTQIDISNEVVDFTFTSGAGIEATIQGLEIEFNSCQGANNINNDLAAYYERLVNEGKALKEEKEKFDKHVVGKTYCREAIDEFLEDRGFVAKPACVDLDKFNCGCEAAKQADYRGTANTTMSGKTCQRWDSQSPQSHLQTRENYENANLIENYCRNPDGKSGVWCYTTDESTPWEYCDIPNCGEMPPAPTPPPTITAQCSDSRPLECGCSEGKQKDYRGQISVTKSGRTCQRWDSQLPHKHSRTDLRYPDSALEGNYCRNPDSEPGAWCYTTDPAKRWEECDVPVCGQDNSTGRLRG